ncbi:MAG: heterotetrameric sarcosine oxidase gamma subunit [Parasphingorhabdus sp.]|jgi:heterotetrameric sarcosine oxidase gamma subunit
MGNRVSALDGHYQPGLYGNGDEVCLIIELVRDLQLSQVVCWPDSIAKVSAMLTDMVQSDAPGPCWAIETTNGSILRTEPLKWWVIDAPVMQLTAEQGSSLDLSHSRTRIRLTGSEATTTLNRLLPLDLRESSFPVGSVGSSAMHHVGVTLWRSTSGYELFVPRGFALACWEVLQETARQFRHEVI